MEVDICMVVFQQIWQKKIQLSYFRRILPLLTKKFLETHQWQEISFKASLKHCHIYQVTLSSTSHNLSDTLVYQQYTTGEIIGIKKANPPFCFNCQRGKKMKSQQILLKAQQWNVNSLTQQPKQKWQIYSQSRKNLPQLVFSGIMCFYS